MTTTEIHANSAALSNAAAYVRTAVELHTDPSQAMQTLHAVRSAQDQLARALPGAVARARRQGKTWEEIGAALGMTRQGAWDQFRDASPVQEDRA